MIPIGNKYIVISRKGIRMVDLDFEIDAEVRGQKNEKFWQRKPVQKKRTLRIHRTGK